jgi:hypothetical protein
MLLKLIWASALVVAVGTVAGGVIEGRPIIALVYASLMIVALAQWWRLRSAVGLELREVTDPLGVLIVLLTLFGVAAPRLEIFGSWLESRWEQQE